MMDSLISLITSFGSNCLIILKNLAYYLIAYSVLYQIHRVYEQWSKVRMKIRRERANELYLEENFNKQR